MPPRAFEGDVLERSVCYTACAGAGVSRNATPCEVLVETNVARSGLDKETALSLSKSNLPLPDLFVVPCWAAARSCGAISRGRCLPAPLPFLKCGGGRPVRENMV